MAITSVASGSQVCTVTTEHFLANINTTGTYVLELDLQPAADLDIFEVRCYKIVVTGGTSRVYFIDTWRDSQPADDYIKVSIPVNNVLTDTNSVRFSIKQTAGTSRTIPYNVLKFA